MIDKKKDRQIAIEIAEKAFISKKKIEDIDSERKNTVLLRMAELLEKERKEIIRFNSLDLEYAADKKIPQETINRLIFDKSKIDSRIESLHKIVKLPDPVGKTTDFHRTDNGLSAGRRRVPLGVILMIYEARPHVTVNGGALCFKAGNAVILRGGSEARQCNAFLGRLWQKALQDSGVAAEAIQVSAITHSQVDEILKLNNIIDIVIPRGSEKFIQYVSEKSRIPVIKHSAGICHVFIDETAKIDNAIKITIDSKCLMPSVCNAAETLLISQALAQKVPQIIHSLRSRGIQIIGCKKTANLAEDVIPASKEDWGKEYLDLRLSVKIVKDVDEAIVHINKFGSHHTDSIITENLSNAKSFTARVDSSVVLVNASTMFCDGETLGMGAEVGISTDKLHTRGPVGMEDLTTYKHVIVGEGHTMGRF